MKIKDVIRIIEEIIPPVYAEDFDNTGLLTGNSEQDLKGILITHDSLEPVIDEAIMRGMNFILSFHPIIFKGLKSITGKNYVERSIIKAIKNDIAIYAVHTALDNQHFGVSGILAQQLGLQNQKTLIPQTHSLRQLVTYAPVDKAEKIREALFSVGAGKIGHYENCSFNVTGTGIFKALEKAQPYVGERGKLHYEEEERISLIFPKHLQDSIIRKLREVHPYEEVAYEIIRLENYNPEIGMGIIGELEQTVDEKEYLAYLKNKLNLSCIRYSGLREKPISKVAVLGGSGSFAIQAALKAGADIFITSDIKYHEFYQSENQMIIADVGHYESEQFTKIFLYEQLIKKIRNFAVAISEINTNPVNYI